MEITRDELKLLGLKIKEIRESQGMSQTQLANIIGKDQPSLNRVERGKVNPSYLYLIQICSGLQISLKELVS